MATSSLDDVKKVIRSLTTPHQNGLTSIALNSEYIELEGRPIPWRSFGSSSLFEFLSGLTDVIMVGLNKAQEQVFFPKVDSSIAHIAKFVQHQRPQPVKRRNNIIRHDLDKRPCRDPSPVRQPIITSPLTPSPPPPERPRRRPGSDRDRESAKRRREPSPMQISSIRSPSPEPDKFRNPSPPRSNRPFRDASPDRSRSRSFRDLSPLAHSPIIDPYEKSLQRARERRGLLDHMSRSRRSRTKSPSPRRRRARTPSPRRVKSKTVSCQTDFPEKKFAEEKQLISVSCQTDNFVENSNPAKAPKPPASISISTSTSTSASNSTSSFAPATEANQTYLDANEVDLNQSYYAPFNNNYNPYSYAYVLDPSYEEDKTCKNQYYDFDAGALKPIPYIPEWYAHWIVNGWAPPTTVQPYYGQPPYPASVPYGQVPMAPLAQPALQPTQQPVPQPVPQPMPQPEARVPMVTSPATDAASRDPRLARQARAANQAKPQAQAQTSPIKRKALSIGDYIKTRKIGASSASSSEKPQVIIREESEETQETLGHSLEYYIKLGSKKPA